MVELRALGLVHGHSEDGLHRPQPPGAHLDDLGAPSEGGHDAFRAGHHHPGVPVGQPEALVVGRDQERSSDIPLAALAEALDLLAQPALDQGRPGRHAVGPAAVPAQQAKRAEGGHGAPPVAVARRRHHRPPGLHGDRPHLVGRRLGGSGVDPAHGAGPGGQGRLDRGGLPPADGGRELADGAAEAVDPAQDHHAVAHRPAPRRRAGLEGLAAQGAEGLEGLGAHDEPVAHRADQIAEHGAGLDRRQLLGVPDQDQPGLGPHRGEQPGHQRERDHRGLVDHHHVVGQVRPGAGPGARARRIPPEQAVQCRPPQPEEDGAHRIGHGQARRLGAHRLLQAQRRLSGRRGQGNKGPRSTGGRLFDEHGEQSGDRRRLAGARTSGDDRQAAQRRRSGRGTLEVGVLGPVEVGGERGPEAGGVDPRGGALGPLEHGGGDRGLVAPVAVEVEAGALQAQRRPRPGQRAGRHLVDPGAGLGPGEVVQGRRVPPLVGTHGGSDPGQVDEDVAEARAAHGEGDGQEHRLGRLGAEDPEAPGHVDVGGAQDRRRVEGGEQPGRLQRPLGPGALGDRRGAHRPRPSSSSLAASTRAGGGRHHHTPGAGSLGLAGGPMPRTNR